MYKSDVETAFKNTGPTDAILLHSASTFIWKVVVVFIFIRSLITRQCRGRAGSCPKVCSTSKWRAATGESKINLAVTSIPEGIFVL